MVQQHGQGSPAIKDLYTSFQDKCSNVHWCPVHVHCDYKSTSV